MKHAEYAAALAASIQDIQHVLAAIEAAQSAVAAYRKAQGHDIIQGQANEKGEQL